MQSFPCFSSKADFHQMASLLTFWKVPTKEDMWRPTHRKRTNLCKRLKTLTQPSLLRSKSQSTFQLTVQSEANNEFLSFWICKSCNLTNFCTCNANPDRNRISLPGKQLQGRRALTTWKPFTSSNFAPSHPQVSLPEWKPHSPHSWCCNNGQLRIPTGHTENTAQGSLLPVLAFLLKRAARWHHASSEPMRFIHLSERLADIWELPGPPSGAKEKGRLGQGSKPHQGGKERTDDKIV